MEKEKMYSTQEAAILIGYSDSRLRFLINAGKAVPAGQLGGTWYFTWAEVERLRSRSRKPGRKPK